VAVIVAVPAATAFALVLEMETTPVSLEKYVIAPVDAETAPEAAAEDAVSDTDPPSVAEFALVMIRLGVAFETTLPDDAVVMLTDVAPVLERTIFWEL